MGAVTSFKFDLVRFYVSAADQVVQGGNPNSLMEDMAPQVERWRQGPLAPQLRPILQLVDRDEKSFPTRMEWETALQQVGKNLSTVLSGAERRILEPAQDQINTAVERRQRRSATSSSGVFMRIANTNAREGEDLRDAILRSVEGSVLTANNTLAALEMTIASARRQPQEVLDTRLGDKAIGEIWTEIREQSHATTVLVSELKSRIDSMTLVVTEDSGDIKDLLLSGGHLKRIFDKLAKVRLLLGQFQKRISASARGSRFPETCWKLYEHAGNCVDLTTWAASLFKGLIQIQRLYGDPRNASSVALHAYLRTSVLQAVLGKDIALRMDLASEAWNVRGPSKAVWQAIINLVAHARQSVHDFGRVDISTRKLSLSAQSAEDLIHHYLSATPQAGDYMVLTVRDSGPGLPSLSLPRVFDLYENGYAMAFMRRVIEDMGGFIGVDSETEGENCGTTFSIYLPKANEPS